MVNNPTVCIKDAVCAIPCAVENTFSTTQQVKVALFEGETMLDVEPDLHYQDIPGGETYEFKGFWDTLTFKPTATKTYNLKVKLRVPTGTLTTYAFSVSCEDKPGFFDSLLASVAIGNQEQITEPMSELFNADLIPGLTLPPYTCPHCGQVFAAGDSSDEAEKLATLQYVAHLTGVLTSFIGDWFEAKK